MKLELFSIAQRTAFCSYTKNCCRFSKDCIAPVHEESLELVQISINASISMELFQFTLADVLTKYVLFSEKENTKKHKIIQRGDIKEREHNHT